MSTACSNSISNLVKRSTSLKLIVGQQKRQLVSATGTLSTIKNKQAKSSSHSSGRKLSTSSKNNCLLIKPLSFGGSKFVAYQTRHYSDTISKPYVDPKLSYVFGRSTRNLEYKTITEYLEERFKESPDELAYICHTEKENKFISYRKLEVDVNRVAKGLLKNNVRKGDFVGVFAFNCYNWLLIQFACSKIGAILSPINPAYKSAELSYLLDKGNVKLLFMPSHKSPQAQLNNHMDVVLSDQVKSICCKDKIKLEKVILIDDECDANSFNLPNVTFQSWKEFADNDGLIYGSKSEADQSDKSDAVWLDRNSVFPDDIFVVYYTSGTTGKPKGALVSHFTALNNAITCQFRYEYKPDKRRIVVTPLPLFHIYAGVLTNMCVLVKNTTVVWTGHKYDMSVLIEAIKEHNCNLLTCTPTILIDMLSYITKNNVEIPSLKYVQTGGAACLPEVAERTVKVLPKLTCLRAGYGSTENGAVATLQSIYEPIETRYQSVGPPIDFTEVRIVSPNTDYVVPHGEKGEIQTRGFNTMIGYLNEPEKTAEVLTKAGWYRTGDVGSIFPNGSIQVNGRLKEMIIKGGENIYPKEVEQMILRMDWIEQVHVFGIPDKRFGEQVCAWVKPKQEFVGSYEPEAVIAHCKENITYFKVPKHVMFVDEFPLTPTKKAQHHVMAEKTIEMLKASGKYEG